MPQASIAEAPLVMVVSGARLGRCRVPCTTNQGRPLAGSSAPSMYRERTSITPECGDERVLTARWVPAPYYRHVGEITGRLPDDPLLREWALALEATGASAEILDSRWRIVYTTRESLEISGLEGDAAERYYGLSAIRRRELGFDAWASDTESTARWAEVVGPVMRFDVGPEDPAFVEVFGKFADAAAAVSPPTEVPDVFAVTDYAMAARQAQDVGAERVHLLFVRLYDRHGEFRGVVELMRTTLRQSVATRLSRGYGAMHERMAALRKPVRRPAAILFADLESSTLIARSLPSVVYFELIQTVTDIVDEAVALGGGIVGKHAGDGASALFVVDRPDEESSAACAAIHAARRIQRACDDLRAEVDTTVNVGLHWGATMTIGQVATKGRLEVTALGDEMNEAARIESAAAGGELLASKALIERLAPDDVNRLDVAPDELRFVSLASLERGEKATRDAGHVFVTRLPSR